VGLRFCILKYMFYYKLSSFCLSFILQLGYYADLFPNDVSG
jgi:hypothetical protein